MLRAINNFCQPGQEGYDKLAVVMVDMIVDVESSIAVEHSNFVDTQKSTVMKAMVTNNGGDYVTCFESYDYTALSLNAE